MYNSSITRNSVNVLKNRTEGRYSRKSSLGMLNDFAVPGGSLTSASGDLIKEYRFCAIEHPSVKPRAGKEVTFFDPSKAEADKTCQDYVKDAEELYWELQRKLQGKPYNQKDLYHGNLILTSMRCEVILRSVISDLLSHHQSSSKKRRLLKPELQETERRSNWYHSKIQELILQAESQETFYKARTYLSYGTFLKITVILQFNLLNKVPYPTERYHYYGIFQIVFYSLLLIFVALPVQLAVRAISQYSKSLVINSWNFCPFFKGVGLITLLIGAHSMLESVSTVSMALYMFIDVLRGRVGWSSCPEGESEYCASAASDHTSSVPCFDTTSSEIPMIMHSGIVYFYSVQDEAFNLSNPNMKFTGLLCIFSIWALVCGFMLIGLERFIKVVDILFTPIFIIALLLLFALYNGNEPMAVGIQNLFNMNAPSGVIQRNLSLFDILLNALVVNGVINFLSAHAPQNGSPVVDTYIFGMTDLFIHIIVTVFVFAAAGSLQGYYKAVHAICFLIYRDITILALIPEFLIRVPFGEYLVVLYLVFITLTQIIYIVIVGFTIVKSVTDLIAEGGAHMYAVFVVVAAGIAMSFFFDLSNSPDNRLSQQILSGIKFSALLAVFFFLFSIVIIYSTSKLCRNITMMTGNRPGPVVGTSIKLSFLIFSFVGYSNIYYIQRNPAVHDWGFLIELSIVIMVPLIFSAMFKISESLRYAKLSLFEPHSNWDKNFTYKQKNVDNPQYKQELYCSHKCLKDNVYIMYEENRNESVRKIFRILHPLSKD